PTPTTPDTYPWNRSPDGSGYADAAAPCSSPASTSWKPPPTSHRTRRSCSSPTDTAMSCVSAANTPSSYPRPHGYPSHPAAPSSTYADNWERGARRTRARMAAEVYLWTLALLLLG